MTLATWPGGVEDLGIPKEREQTRESPDPILPLQRPPFAHLPRGNEEAEGFIVEANGKRQVARLVASGKRFLTATAPYSKK